MENIKQQLIDSCFISEAEFHHLICKGYLLEDIIDILIEDEARELSAREAKMSVLKNMRENCK